MNYRDTYMWKEIAQSESVVEKLFPAIAPTVNEITTACEMRQIKHIFLAGRGTSDHALLFFKYVTEINSPYTASLVAPSVVTMYDGKADFSGSLVIGCSQSGCAADVRAIVERANEQGAVTVAITNDEQSPLAKEAKYHLFLNAEKEISVAATKTFTAQLYTLLTLSCALAKRADLVAKYATLSTRMASYYAQADFLTDAEAQELKSVNDGFILARGITYAIAFESALKLAETSYMKMRGYASSDFYHGPMAMVDEGTKVLLYAPSASTGSAERDEAHLQDRKKCIEKMLSLKANLTIITDDEALNEYASQAKIATFDRIGDEIESTFAFALYAQMLACKTSCLKGNNPDSPKALQKVTVTV